MSRTFRRNKTQRIKNWVGTYEDHMNDDLLWKFHWHGRPLDEFFTQAYQDRLLKEYQQRVVDYTSDNRSGQYNVPRWFRNLFTRDERREQRREIYRCMSRDEWDDFLVIKNPDEAAWQWF